MRRNLSEPLPGLRQTNQRAELTALKRALDITPLNRHVHIFSDSSYAIKCVTEWFIAWRRNDWKTSNGKKAVENRDIIEEILGRIEEREQVGVRTRFEWLKGHAQSVGNTEADRLAVEGANDARRRGMHSDGVRSNGARAGEALDGQEGTDGADGQEEEEDGVDQGTFADRPTTVKKALAYTYAERLLGAMAKLFNSRAPSRDGLALEFDDEAEAPALFHASLRDSFKEDLASRWYHVDIAREELGLRAVSASALQYQRLSVAADREEGRPHSVDDYYTVGGLSTIPNTWLAHQGP